MDSSSKFPVKRQSNSVHSITIGRPDSLFSPAELSNTVPKGDVIEFTIVAGTHSIVRADPKAPCTPFEKYHPMEGKGFFSGELTPDIDNDKWWIVVNDDSPIVFYDASAKKCDPTMVGVINADKFTTLEAVKGRAGSKATLMQPWEVGPGSCTFPQVVNTWTITIFAGGVLALVIILLCVCVGVNYCCGWKRGWKPTSRDDHNDEEVDFPQSVQLTSYCSHSFSCA